MTETYTTIATAIERHPGVHFRGLVRRLDLAPGQVQYHLRRLQENDAVVAEELYGMTHYFAPGYSLWKRRACVLLRRETAGDIVGYLLTNGPSSPSTVATDIDIARSTLSWHVDRLVEQDLVRKRRNDGSGISLVLERPLETARILHDVDPSLWERLVGRFSRLVDRLLEESGT